MSGEISNLYGNSLYGYNPYSVNNDDFLAQQYFAQNAQNPAFQGYQQPQTDSFEKRGGLSLSTGLGLGAVAGAGTGAGIYFWGSNPVQEGRVSDDILQKLDASNTKQVAIDKAKDLLTIKKQEILKNLGVPDGVTLKTLKAYYKSPMPSSFPSLHGVLTQDQAKDAYKAAKKEIKNIDLDAIAKEAQNFAKEETLQFKKDKLSKLKQQKVQLEALADGADLEKFFKDNAKAFGIEGDAAAIDAEAKRLAAKYKDKAGAVADYTTQISNQETLVKSTRDTLNGKVMTYYDDAAKSLKNGTPEVITKAFKDFKWNKALKGGGIAAAAGLVLGLLFGNNA